MNCRAWAASVVLAEFLLVGIWIAMRRLIRLLSVVAVIWVLAPAQNLWAQDTAPAIANVLATETISAGRDIPEDRDINRRIKGIFAEFGSLKSVVVSVRSGVVTLRGNVPDQLAIEQAETLAARVEGVVAVSNQLLEDTSVSERIVPMMERLTSRLIQALHYIPLLTVGILAFLIIAASGWWIAARRWPFEKIAPNAFISDLLRQIVRLVFIGLGLVLALDIIGATAVIGTVLGAAGIVGLAVGFAVRDTVENYIASILLSLRQPFRPNDFVEISEQMGRVIMLTSRATVLLSVDGNHIRIPNSTVFKSVITNYTRHPDRRFGFELGIAPSGDLQLAVETGLGVLEELDFVLKKPGPEARIERLGDSTVQLWFAGWIDQRETSLLLARAQAIRRIMRALENAGFELPEPGYRITMIGSEEAVSKQKTGKPKFIEQDPLEDSDTAVVDDMMEIVEEERAHLHDQDLLKEDAPQEIG